MAAVMRTLGLFLSLAFLLVAMDSSAQEKEVKKPKSILEGIEKNPDEPKKETPDPKKEEKLVYGTKFTAKIKRIDSNAARLFGLEITYQDPVKVAQAQQWAFKERASIRTPQDLARFQQSYAQKMQREIFSSKDVDYQASDNCKVRAMFLPVEYDDMGALKKWSKADIQKFKEKDENPKWPGSYVSEFENLRPGQIVDIYLAKAPPMPKEAKDAKPAKIIPDENPDAKPKSNLPEVVLMVILQDSFGR